MNLKFQAVIICSINIFILGTDFHNTHTEKKLSGNLIDFNTSATDGLTSRDKNVRVSLLEAFDPLVTCDSPYGE